MVSRIYVMASKNPPEIILMLEPSIAPEFSAAMYPDQG